MQTETCPFSTQPQTLKLMRIPTNIAIIALNSLLATRAITNRNHHRRQHNHLLRHHSHHTHSPDLKKFLSLKNTTPRVSSKTMKIKTSTIISVLTLFIATAIPTIGQTTPLKRSNRSIEIEMSHQATPLEHNNKSVKISHQTFNLIRLAIPLIILAILTILTYSQACIMAPISTAPIPATTTPKPATPKPTPSTELQDIRLIF